MSDIGLDWDFWVALFGGLFNRCGKGEVESLLQQVRSYHKRIKKLEKFPIRRLQSYYSLFE